LRSVIDGFEEWDVLAKRERFDNDACKYMYELRNVIEKEARTPTAVAVDIVNFNTSDIDRFPRPPGAHAFFIGDQNGGTGWQIIDSSGNETPYYVALPEEFGRVWLMLPEHDGGDAFQVASAYIGALEAYLADMKAFLGVV
jgi:hypothetical protein